MTLQERLDSNKYAPYGGYAKFLEIYNNGKTYEERAMELAKTYHNSMSWARNQISQYKKTALDGISQ